MVQPGRALEALKGLCLDLDLEGKPFLQGSEWRRDVIGLKIEQTSQLGSWWDNLGESGWWLNPAVCSWGSDEHRFCVTLRRGPTGGIGCGVKRESEGKDGFQPVEEIRNTRGWTVLEDSVAVLETPQPPPRSQDEG